MYRGVLTFLIFIFTRNIINVFSFKYELMDNIIPSRLLEVTSSRSASQCCVVCAEKNDCKYITYNGNNNECHLHRQHFVQYSLPASNVYYEGESYFELVMDLLSRDAAQLNCESKGGHLINIKTSSKSNEIGDVITAMISSGVVMTHPWIGGKYAHAHGDFLWTDGSHVTSGFTNCAPTQPDNFGGNEDCIHLEAAWNKWNDIDCNGQFWSICEYDL